MSDLSFKYICTECGLVFDIDGEIMLCPECAKKNQMERPLRGVLEVYIEGHLDRMPDDNRVLLPIEKQFYPDIPVGYTPLWRPERLRNEHGDIYLKDDTRNPTGSLKDRASWLVAAQAKKFGHKRIAVASTGNAASSMAGIGASAGLDITIFVPKSAPPAKLVQSLQYGARVIPVDGNYDMAFDISMEYVARTDSLSRNTAHNPMTIEGKKTAALEIFRDLGRVPDYVFVPVGDGVIISGVFKGFSDLVQLGLADGMPKIIGIQAEDSSAIYRSFKRNPKNPSVDDFRDPKATSTIADSICVDIPRNGYYALSLLRKHKGDMITVTDGEITKAQKSLSTISGLFSEPAGATSYAGFLKYEVPKDALSVILVTGNGLKDIDGARKGVIFPERAIKSVEEIL